MIRPAILLAACAFACTAFAQTVFPQAAFCATAPADSEASQAASGSVTTSAPHFYHHRHYSRHSSSSRSLPSRGIVSPSEAAVSVVGRLALVTSDKAVIIAGREASGRVLSVCPKGQYLALSGETPTQYAVLMIDHSTGFVAKSDVQLLDYQVVNNASDAPGDGSTGSSTIPNDGSLGAQLVQTAQGYLGVPYVWGGNTAAGIDCSGFVKAVYAAHGISLPRVSGDQATVGYDVPRGDWSKWVAGDRMYFACHHARIDHTGMYIGGGYFIHSSMGHGQSVAIDRVDGAYYAQHLVCVRRSRELVGDAPAPGPVSQTASANSAPSSSNEDAESSQF
ncbi:MAG: C40 family peptidase [Janthinobacterium lividum]